MSACTAIGGEAEDVGPDGSPLTTATVAFSWNGRLWTQQSFPTAGGAAATTPFAVSCSAPSSCVAVGASEYTASDGTNDRLPDQFAAAAWNGTSWTAASLPPQNGRVDARDKDLSAVSCVSTSSCVAVGRAPTLAAVLDRGTWSYTRIPHTPNTGPLTAVDCLSPNWCMAVGAALAERYS